MERIEAVELLNTHFFADTSKCREAWYSIRAELVESVPSASHNTGSPKLPDWETVESKCCVPRGYCPVVADRMVQQKAKQVYDYIIGQLRAGA